VVEALVAEMSAQRLNAKKTRQAAEATGLDVIRVWTRGDAAWVEFVTREDRHGLLNRKSGEWRWYDDAYHFDTCKDIDPSQPTGYREDTPEESLT
jgi:hypothetical protein